MHWNNCDLLLKCSPNCPDGLTMAGILLAIFTHINFQVYNTIL